MVAPPLPSPTPKLILQVLLDQLRRTNTLTLLGDRRWKEIRSHRPPLHPSILLQLHLLQKSVSRGQRGGKKRKSCFALVCGFVSFLWSDIMKDSQIDSYSSFANMSNFIELHWRSNGVGGRISLSGKIQFETAVAQRKQSVSDRGLQGFLQKTQTKISKEFWAGLPIFLLPAHASMPLELHGILPKQAFFPKFFLQR